MPNEKPLWMQILERNQNMEARQDDEDTEIKLAEYSEFNEIEEFDKTTEKKIAEFLSVEEHGFIPLENGEVIALKRDYIIPDGASYKQAAFIDTLIKEGKYRKAKRIANQIKRRQFYIDLYRSLGLRERGGLPLRLCADDLIRLESYNRRVRANRLLGKDSGEPIHAIPLDVYAYIWKNSVILARNNMHVFMMPMKWVARGMGIDKTSVSSAFRTIEDVGLIKRIGRVTRDNRQNIVAFEIVDLDTFFKDNKLKIPKNYRIRDRVTGDIVVSSEKRRRPNKLNKVVESEKKKINNPLWGMFTDVIDQKK